MSIIRDTDLSCCAISEVDITREREIEADLNSKRRAKVDQAGDLYQPNEYPVKQGMDEWILAIKAGPTGTCRTLGTKM